MAASYLFLSFVWVDVCEMSLISFLGNRDRNRGLSSRWLLAYLSLSGSRVVARFNVV